ncbi:hypothetical protein EYF80_038414 [Liparis tanakae]|uniref:Uncharacterized protein n=1 Tax=Liparis tanakae TaxID=230148 RepID=A0A4Z2GCT4_9TELE|nr:hypothetical protein EYF80_038414 [Liparis tanakae]
MSTLLLARLRKTRRPRPRKAPSFTRRMLQRCSDRCVRYGVCLNAPPLSSWRSLPRRSNFTVICEGKAGSHDLVHIRRNVGQVPVDAGHRELDLVTDALIRTFCRESRRDAEEQQPEGL